MTLTICFCNARGESQPVKPYARFLERWLRLIFACSMSMRLRVPVDGPFLTDMLGRDCVAKEEARRQLPKDQRSRRLHCYNPEQKWACPLYVKPLLSVFFEWIFANAVRGRSGRMSMPSAKAKRRIIPFEI
jgi:hypothetical protein